MVYHFKQTIVVKREQEIPNYTVQRTMIRKTTQAHKAQEEQSGWKIKKSIAHIQLPCSFILLFPCQPPLPTSSPPQRPGVLQTLPREKPLDPKGKKCRIYSSVGYLRNIRPAGVSAGMPFIPQHKCPL